MSKTEEETNDAPKKLGSEKWLDAYYDPVASLYTFTQCIALSDISADGDSKLIIADLGTGTYDMKLKVYKGTSLITENAIIDMPTAVVTFFMDTNEPRTPAIAVASGPYIYVYRNLRPYFKFTLPTLEISQLELEGWNQIRDGRIGVTGLCEILDSLRKSAVPMTVRSQRLLQLAPHDLDDFVNMHKGTPLKRQTVITCMGTLKKSLADDDAISCLVIGTESKEVYVLDPAAFTVLATKPIPSVPVFLYVSGMFDVEFTLLVACRNGKVYGYKRSSTAAKELFSVSSHIVGMIRVGKSIVVGCMDDTLQCHSAKGKRLWSAKMAASIMTIEPMEYRNKGFAGAIVALANREVHIYQDKYLVDIIVVEDVVTGLRFGKFGREDATLIMATTSGGLIVKMLKRSAQFEGKALMAGPPPAQQQKLDVPRKTKLFVDQTVRERESATDMHRQFQHDLVRMRLETARSYAKVLSNSMTPISIDQSEPIKLQAQIHGIGPTFKMSVSLQNTSISKPSIDLFISFDYDNTLYHVHKPLIMVPMLVPGLNYIFETFVECLNNKGISDVIKVFVLKKNNSVPIITAVVSMPVSEAVVVV